MAILRWDTGKDAMFVQDRMSKLFEYVLSNLSVDLSAPSPWIPPCDVFENQDNFIIKAEVPGLSMEDVVLEITDNTVIMVGVRKRESSVSDENYLRIERSYGRFARRFILPCGVDENKVSATLHDGLLTVSIQKEAVGQSPKKIQVDIQK